MLINSLLLALSSSIDSLGIGITYGIKNTKISIISQIVLFIISIFVTTISVMLGSVIKNFLSDIISKFIGSGILIILGVIIIIQTKEKSSSFDFNHSNIIDPSEAIALGIALSLDSLCIGIGGSVFGLNISMFPILVATLQLAFLNLGNFLGRKLIKKVNIPSGIWSVFSGVLLVLIGAVKFRM